MFLVLALQSGDGRDTVATILFAFVAATDWFDGMAARITGQYSRLGALLDPLTDRLLVLSGAIVAWHFELLPRWALLVLAAREAFMLVLTELALRARHRPERQHARALGGLAGDGRARPGDDRRDLGIRSHALLRARDHPCGDRSAICKMVSRPCAKAQPQLEDRLYSLQAALPSPKGSLWTHSLISELSPTGS